MLSLCKPRGLFSLALALTQRGWGTLAGRGIFEESCAQFTSSADWQRAAAWVGKKTVFQKRTATSLLHECAWPGRPSGLHMWTLEMRQKASGPGSNDGCRGSGGEWVGEGGWGRGCPMPAGQQGAAQRASRLPLGPSPQAMCCHALSRPRSSIPLTG